jgi:molybdopterin converting factor small subunit
MDMEYGMELEELVAELSDKLEALRRRVTKLEKLARDNDLEIVDDDDYMLSEQFSRDGDD